ncbi:hypothetical protein FRB93_005935 [Tulasnella sp. JGI-2019a]|nr:hypothetical protein FRB93_005935 [Tulasnella sp. JGI-2019a]
MRQFIRTVATAARAAEAPSSLATTSGSSTATRGRSRTQPPRPAKPVQEELLAKARARRAAKTHKKWDYTRMFQKTDITLGPISEPRILSHYNHTLATDLFYLTYRHEEKIKIQKVPERDVNNPYTLNRPPPQPRGGGVLRPAASPTTHEHVPRLEKIVLHTYVKEAQGKREAILSAMALLRQLSGELEGAGGNKFSKGVEVCRSRKTSSSFRITKDIPISVKVEIKGEKMYDFIGTLVEFVLPRIRDFSGITMPVPSASATSPSAISGVVAFGLPPSAMSLFPQVEVNYDSYPRSHGLNIDFVTNIRGQDAQNKARALVSGFRIPFVRK